MATDRDALHLRLLQTVLEAAAEKNSAQVMPVPVELLRFFDRVRPAAAQATGQDEPAAAAAKNGDLALPAPPEPTIAGIAAIAAFIAAAVMLILGGLGLVVLSHRGWRARDG
jgi:hypothetical protein